MKNSKSSLTLLFISLLTTSHISSAARLSVLFGGSGSGSNGKSYVRVFVTSTTYDGNLGGITGADAKCQARADAASLGGTWKAIISDSTTNAIGRVLNRTKPVFTIAGKLAWNPSQQVILGGDTNAVYGSGALPFGPGVIASAIYTTELGTTPGSAPVWTATNTAGVTQGTSHCSNWTSNSSGLSGYYGNASSNSNIWIVQNVLTCNNTNRLYCLEDE